MSDDMDRAQAREEEMRADAIADLARRANEQAGHVSAELCQVCDLPIPAERRIAVPGVQTCLECQADLEYALKGVRRK